MGSIEDAEVLLKEMASEEFSQQIRNLANCASALASRIQRIYGAYNVAKGYGRSEEFVSAAREKLIELALDSLTKSEIDLLQQIQHLHGVIKYGSTVVPGEK